MDHDGYWYRYLAARHDFALKFGLVILCAALVSILSGKTLVKFRGIVARSEDPKTFWESVVTLVVMGVALIGLYAFGPS